MLVYCGLINCKHNDKRGMNAKCTAPSIELKVEDGVLLSCGSYEYSPSSPDGGDAA